MHRQKWETWAEILDLARKPIRKTSIMFKANLSYYYTKRYIRELVLLGLLATNSPDYQTTEKGKIFLDVIGQVKSLTSSDQKTSFFCSGCENALIYDMVENRQRRRTSLQAESRQRTDDTAA